ncbi:MAG: GGDEF domain-containing protein, partial [Gammaproteobacteria bacterium]|nr:GGDEF domain-containing protein [Gammaproteobacteria bacterium]
DSADEESGDPERESMLSFLREARARMRHADGRDNTTGVLNRRAFDDLMHRDWALARREQRSLAVIVFQVDCFAAYRDVFDRHAADACLRKVANVITGNLRRAGDLTACYSEDRFAVLFGLGDSRQALERAEIISDRVRELALHHPRSVLGRFVTVSYGVASATPETLHNKPDLIAMAEADLLDCLNNRRSEQSVG